MPIITTYEQHDDAPVPQRRTSKAGSIKRPSSRAGSVRNSVIANGNGHQRESSIGAAAPGEVMTHERQQQLQQSPSMGSQRGVALQDHGMGNGNSNRTTTFDEASSHRPRSAFGHRPEPVLNSVTEDHRESQYGGGNGRDSRAGVLNRSGTVLSRAGTNGRNGALSRGANGGTVGSRRGAFGRGAGTTIGTQPEEVLGRE